MPIFDQWESILSSQGVVPGKDRFASPCPIFTANFQELSIRHVPIRREIDLKEMFSAESEYLNINHQPVFAYLRIGRGEPRIRKVHFTYCEQLKASESGKYFGTTRNDGLFEIDEEKKGVSEPQEYPLEPCLRCIGDYYGLPNKSDWPEKKRIRDNFSYKDIAHEIGLTLNQAIWHSRLYRYTDKTWEERSFEVRANAGWACEKCGLVLGLPYRYFLHAHHRIGDRNFNHSANLMACCIRCHAEEPGHENMKGFMQYRQFMKLLNRGTFMSNDFAVKEE